MRGRARGQDRVPASRPQLPGEARRTGRLGAQGARFRLEDGGAYALLGPSGCGKSTLLEHHLRPAQAEPGPRPL
ncbi:MAG: ATP-binding cassette domain-containing protein [Geminicoccaceae bacterium]